MPDCFIIVGQLICMVGMASGSGFLTQMALGVFAPSRLTRLNGDLCFTHLINNNRKNSMLLAECFHERALCN